MKSVRIIGIRDDDQLPDVDVFIVPIAGKRRTFGFAFLKLNGEPLFNTEGMPILLARKLKKNESFLQHLDKLVRQIKDSDLMQDMNTIQ